MGVAGPHAGRARGRATDPEVRRDARRQPVREARAGLAQLRSGRRGEDLGRRCVELLLAGHRGHDTVEAGWRVDGRYHDRSARSEQREPAEGWWPRLAYVLL